MDARTGNEKRKPSRQVFGELPVRVVVFLRAVGSHRSIQQILAPGGYTSQQHAEGLRLLIEVCALRDEALPLMTDVEARQASAELAAWLGSHAARLRIALERLHSKFASVFDRLEATTPVAGVLAVATLLERLRDLCTASDPSALAALETLAQRGLDEAERSRLAALVAAAQAATTLNDMQDDGAAREEALLQLHDWFRDWATTARALVKRKDQLIILGLAGRRKRVGLRP